MIQRDELIDSMLEEIRIIKYLARRIPAERLHWRPSPGQRSMHELMQYLTRAGEGITLTLVNGNRDHAERLLKRAESVTARNFEQLMDEQAAGLKRALEGVSHARLANERAAMPWGGPGMSLGAAIMNSGLKFLSAYRMQLFLYLKQLGRQELGTAQCWAGREPAPK
ncbi:MAG: hypothetical protein H6840_04425 [Planctomycetes bacterium]|nr:hypothetical protein [Planctomycetota bacterium]